MESNKKKIENYLVNHKDSWNVKGLIIANFGSIRVTHDHMSGYITVSGNLPSAEYDKNSISSCWSYDFSIVATPTSPVIVSGIDGGDNHFLLEMSDGSTIVFNKYGIVGKTFRVDEDSEVKDKVHDLVTKISASIEEGVTNLISELIEKSESEIEDKPIWVENKSGIRYKIPRESLQEFLDQGYKVSPHKRPTKK